MNEKVVVDLPNWDSVNPRIPDTAQRRTLERQRRVREIVFGMQDGVLTTLGIVTGIGVAAPDRLTVLLSGIVALIAGALSMGVGEFLGRKSEREVVEATIAMEKREMDEHPLDEFAEQVAYYKLKGFSADEAHTIVNRLTKNPDIYLYEMMRDEFGIDPRIAGDSAVRPGFAMAGSYALGSIVPLLPYVVNASRSFQALSGLFLAAIALFTIGVFAARVSGRNPVLKGLEIVAYGALVFAASYAAGRYIPVLFGHAPLGGA